MGLLSNIKFYLNSTAMTKESKPLNELFSDDIKQYVNSRNPNDSSFMTLDQLIEQRYTNTSSLLNSQTNTIDSSLNTQTNSITTAITNARNYLCLKPVNFSININGSSLANSTILNVSGPGVLHYACFRPSGGTISNLRILIDGTHYVTAAGSGTGNTMHYILTDSLFAGPSSVWNVAGLFWRHLESSTVPLNGEIFIPFKKTLTITVGSITVQAAGSIAGRYSIYSQT